MAPTRQTARGLQLAALALVASPWIVLALAALSSAGWLPEFGDRAVAVLTACPHRLATGEPCPLCGTTTAALLLFAGELRASLAVNPIAAALVLPGAVQLAYRAHRVRWPRLSWKEEAIVAGLSAAAGVGTRALLELAG